MSITVVRPIKKQQRELFFGTHDSLIVKRSPNKEEKEIVVKTPSSAKQEKHQPSFASRPRTLHTYIWTVDHFAKTQTEADVHGGLYGTRTQ